MNRYELTYIIDTALEENARKELIEKFSALIALGSYGLGDRARAEAAYREVLAIDPAHMGAHIQRMLL